MNPRTLFVPRPGLFPGKQGHHTLVFLSEWHELGIFVFLEKGPDLLGALFRKDRTGAVEEMAARLQYGPERTQKAALLTGERRDVFGAADPGNVGLTANDAACRAGRVEEDRVEGTPVKPLLRAGRIGRDELGREPETIERISDFLRALRIDFKGRHFTVATLEQMRRLSARRGTGVEHPIARTDGKQVGGELRAGVLNGHESLGKSR